MIQPHPPPPTRRFIRPSFEVECSSEIRPEDAIRTLNDLVQYNATHNAKHIFRVQYHHDLDEEPLQVTYGELYDAVLRCCSWLVEKGPSWLRSPNGDKASPTAILMSSDITWYIVFLSLLRLGVPVLSVSPRLSSQAIIHLLNETGTETALTASHTRWLADEVAKDWPRDHSTRPTFHEVPGDYLFLNRDPTPQTPVTPRTSTENDRKVVILHSSGTTGLPKPIYHTHAYLLGYAACHQLSEEDVCGAVNVSTLPLYHGFGLLAPCLALSTGLTYVSFPPTIIPTASSVEHILRASGATSLMTVPSILEDLYLSETGAAATKALQKLDFVAVGGAAMKESIARTLANARVRLLNHWGVTEIGAIAPIIRPTDEHDWRYLRLRDDLRLRIEPIANGQTSPRYHQLIGYAPGSHEEVIVQDLLEVNPNAPSTEFRIAGRADDLIVLATGEKIRPTSIEAAVSDEPLVRAALAFGDGRFQIGLIVEAAAHIELDLSDVNAVSEYVARVWLAVEHANSMSDSHAEVTREMLVITTPHTKPLLRTPKGSVPRGPNVERFAEEIESKYACNGCQIREASMLVEPERGLREVVRSEVIATLNRAAPFIGDEDDFFVYGMNSLQAAVLHKRLQQFMSPARALPRNLIYAKPSVSKLAAALHELRVGSETCPFAGERAASMQDMVGEYIARLPDLQRSEPASSAEPDSRGMRILLVGSTGSLGGAILRALMLSGSVEIVYALNRHGQVGDMRRRQEAALDKLGSALSEARSEVVLLEGELGQARFGLREDEYERLRDVTHIIHNAWPMNFNQTLASFRSQFELVMNIVQLANECNATTPIRIFFSSSIAVVGRYPLTRAVRHPIQESSQILADDVEHLGYAEAKWVCEKLYEGARGRFSNRLTATNVRFGQLSGSEVTGIWNVNEHLPMMVKSCQAVGRVPVLEGHASWIPVDRAGTAVVEMLLSNAELPTFLHLENPARRSWADITRVIGATLGIVREHHLEFTDWLRLVEALPDPVANPSVKIAPFLDDSFKRLATGDVVLDTTESCGVSSTLESCESVTDELIMRYIGGWRRAGFLA